MEGDVRKALASALETVAGVESVEDAEESQWTEVVKGGKEKGS